MTFTRRRFVTGTAALFAFAACRSDRGSSPETLRFSNRPFYIDGETLPAFERARRITVEYHEDQVDDDAFAAALRASGREGIGRDLAVVSDQAAVRLVEDSLVEPFGADIAVGAMRGSIARPGPVQQVPWAIGVTGLAIARAFAPAAVRSVEDLFAPAFAGRVAFVRGPTESVALALLASGVSPETASRADLAAATERIMNARRSQAAIVVDTVFEARLGQADGAWLAVGNAADVAQLIAEGADVTFVEPAEGGVLWTDDLVIPRGAENPDAAAAFVEYVYQPEVSRRLFAALPFVSPVEGVGTVPDGLHRLRDLGAEEVTIVADALA